MRFDSKGNRDQNLTLWNYNGTDWVTTGIVRPDESFFIDASAITWPDGKPHDSWADVVAQPGGNGGDDVDSPLAPILGSFGGVVIVLVAIVL